MKKSMFLMLIVMMISSSAFAGKAFEGYWEQTSITKSTMPMQAKEEQEKQVIHYKQGKMKIHDVDEGKVTIFRFDKELMWEIDLKRKSYTEVTFAAWRTNPLPRGMRVASSACSSSDRASASSPRLAATSARRTL